MWAQHRLATAEFLFYLLFIYIVIFRLPFYLILVIYGNVARVFFF